MRLFKATSINFLGARNVWYLVSTLVIAAGLTSLLIRGIDFGIDFRGGSEMIVRFQQKVDIAQIRTALGEVGLGRSEIKTFGIEQDILIRVSEDINAAQTSTQIKEALKVGFAANPFEVLQEQRIGPKIGKELRTSATYAIVWSLVAIMAYIGIRFQFIYGIGALLSLAHDVLVTLGILSILNSLDLGFSVEITQEVVAAFLTIIGVSVNDTVVVFDRIRETLKIHRALPLQEAMNKSVNEMLGRTIITNGTIFVVLLVLLLFGGEVIRGFAFTLAIGQIAGTYSSIYIASAVVLDTEKLKLSKKPKKS
ncbi:MAG: protein translocase subunit SecF [Bacteroidetes bacterium]|nr:protein translocase subunit SecF [Bacteroidota bacterium]